MAIEKVRAIMAEKNPNLENKEEVAEAVGVGAIVFYYLTNSRIKDNDFSLDDALSFEGNTGPYAQYTYARCCSIIEKAGGVDFSKPLLLGYTGLSDALLLKYIEDSKHIWAAGRTTVPYTTIGSVIGTHAGPGAVAVAFFHA